MSASFDYRTWFFRVADHLLDGGGHAQVWSAAVQAYVREDTDAPYLAWIALTYPDGSVNAPTEIASESKMIDQYNKAGYFTYIPSHSTRKMPIDSLPFTALFYGGKINMFDNGSMILKYGAFSTDPRFRLQDAYRGFYATQTGNSSIPFGHSNDPSSGIGFHTVQDVTIITGTPGTIQFPSVHGLSVNELIFLAIDGDFDSGAVLPTNTTSYMFVKTVPATDQITVALTLGGTAIDMPDDGTGILRCGRVGITLMRSNAAGISVPGFEVTYNGMAALDLTRALPTGGFKGDGTANFFDIYINGSAVAILASPAFTGTPTAPTAANGTNTAQLATTAFVQNAAALILAGVSSSFDTLAEIATELALKAYAANAALTGTPTAPTASANTNTTQIATTAYVVSSTITFTNKTFDTAGTGNSFKVNGTAITDKTGTGKAVLDTNPTIDAGVFKGTWTASGTVIFPAYTLSGTLTGGANIISDVKVKPTQTTVGALPAAATHTYEIWFVTDNINATPGLFATAGGTAKIPVYSDGANWYTM